MAARELSKVHEELVRGPISTILRTLRTPRGEYTLVVSGAEAGEAGEQELPTAEQLRSEFGQMTADLRLGRRDAIAAIAKKYGLRPNAVYRSIEQNK
jgi:16S rRNA (cytidine1402-2'-O)-methyltransferase